MVLREAAPEPVASISGTQPRMKANEVMRIGRRRSFEPSHGRVENLDAFLAFHLGELDDEDRVLGRQPDEHDQADLRIDVQVEVAHQHANHRAQHDGRRGQQHREGQPPAFILRRQQQEHEEHAMPKMTGAWPSDFFSCSVRPDHS